MLFPRFEKSCKFFPYVLGMRYIVGGQLVHSDGLAGSMERLPRAACME